MIVIYYIMQNSFEWQNWMIVNLSMGTIQHVQIFVFQLDDIVLSTFTKNAIKSFVIGIGVLILNLNYFLQ